MPSRARPITRLISAACVMLAGVAVVGVPSAEALRVSAKRIVFEGRERSQTITIINDSATEQTYRLEWRNFRMTEDKMLENVKDAKAEGLRTAEDLVRFAPKRVTVPAGQTQQVRLMTRLPDGLLPGEYRSHLSISPENPAAEFSPEEKERAKTAPVVKINMLTALSVPVFVRHGTMSSGAFVENAIMNIQGNTAFVKMTVVREGNRSLYGDMDFICTAGDNDVVIKQMMGVAVYTDVIRRNLSYDIPIPAGAEQACSEMRVEYRAAADDQVYKGGIITRANLARLR